MRVFCGHIKKAVFSRFNLEIDVFVSRRKRLVHFAFPQPLMGYSFYRDLIYFVKREWKLGEMLSEDYKIFFPRLISSVRWIYDYVFFQEKKTQ